MTKQEKSAIIGYYRNGATLLEIMLITGIAYFIIDRIVLDHPKNHVTN